MKKTLLLSFNLLFLLTLSSGAGCSSGDRANRIDIHSLVFSPQQAILLGSLSMDNSNGSYLWSYDISTDSLAILKSCAKSRKPRLLPGSSTMAFAYTYRQPVSSNAMNGLNEVFETESIIQFGGNIERESALVLPFPYLEPQLFAGDSVFVGRLSECDPPQISLVALDINAEEIIGKLNGTEFTSQYSLVLREIDGQPLLFVRQDCIKTGIGMLHLCSVPDLTTHYSVPVGYQLMRGARVPSSLYLYSDGQEKFAYAIVSAQATHESYRIKIVEEDVIDLSDEQAAQRAHELLVAEEGHVVIVAHDPPTVYIISTENNGQSSESHILGVSAMSRLTMDSSGEFVAWCDRSGSVFIMDLAEEVPTIIREIGTDRFSQAVENFR